MRLPHSSFVFSSRLFDLAVGAGLVGRNSSGTVGVSFDRWWCVFVAVHRGDLCCQTDAKNTKLEIAREIVDRGHWTVGTQFELRVGSVGRER